MQQTKIAITAERFIDWTGGIDYLSSIIKSIAKNDRYVLYVIIPVSPFQLLKNLIIGSKRGENTQDGEKILRSLKSQNVKILSIPKGTAALYVITKLIRANVIGPRIFPLPKYFKIPWFSYIADYQHVYLPYLFSERELILRDDLFNALLKTSNATILSSQHAIEDAVKHSGASRDKLYQIPIMNCPEESWLTNYDADSITMKGRYFICSNQLCVHKEHKTLFLAFAKFVKEFPEVEIVCTGNLDDYRSPGYYAEIMELLSSLDIKDKVQILGLIPKNKQMNLMKNAVAVVQPSLFEGGPGGGAGYDAEAIGQRVILSDTTVNIESNYRQVTFFKASDPNALYEALKTVYLEDYKPPCSSKLMEDGYNRLEESCKMFTKMIEKIKV